MALANYTDLKASVADWLHRTDLTTQIVDFITLAESRINRDLNSRLSEEDAALTGTVGVDTVALPTDFINPLGLWITTYNPRESLIYKLPEKLIKSTSNGNPRYYTISGSNIEFEYPLDTAYTYTLRYKSGYALSVSATTNWLLTNHPDVYLYAALIESAVYVRDSAQIPVWTNLYQEALTGVRNKEMRNKTMDTLSVDGGLRGNRVSNILDGDYYYGA